MNKQEYLDALEQSLKAHRVPDIGDIIAEYEQHFEFKLRDGYSESKVAAKLENPDVIAEQFAKHCGGKQKAAGKGVLTRILLPFADLFAGLFFILLVCWVIAIGAFTIAFAALGVSLAAGFNLAGIIPYMPYAGSLVLGVAVLSLSVLAAVAAIYCCMFLKQLFKAYRRWRKNKLNSGSPLPPLSKHPDIADRTRRRLRNTALVALVIFCICSMAALFILFAHAGFKPFWHEWRWFE